MKKIDVRFLVTYAATVLAIVATVVAVLTLSACHLTPAQQTAVVAKVEQVGIDLAKCALDGPGATALQTYLAHRLDADPAAVRADIAESLHAGIGRDVVCALSAIAGRVGQAEGELVSHDPAVLIASRASSCDDLKCGRTESRAAAILMTMIRAKQVK